jgi:hypothetical protein
VLQTALILMACTLLYGCSHNRATEEHVDDPFVACGTVIGEDRAPVSKVLIELHELAKDTPEDVGANRYELTGTDEDGRFRLKAAIPDRQYWLAVAGTRACSGLTMAERESKRLPITFRRSLGESQCQEDITVVLDSHCNLKLR